MLVLPLPVEPIIATVSPLFTLKDTSSIARLREPAYENETFLNSTVPFSLLSLTFPPATDGTSESTSPIRFAEAAARVNVWEMFARCISPIIIIAKYVIDAIISPGVTLAPASA